MNEIADIHWITSKFEIDDMDIVLSPFMLNNNKLFVKPFKPNIKDLNMNGSALNYLVGIRIKEDFLDKVSPEYLAKLLKSELGQLFLGTIAQSGVIPRFNLERFSQLRMPFPELAVQEEILSSYDLVKQVKTKLKEMETDLCFKPSTSKELLVQLQEVSVTLDTVSDTENIKYLCSKGESDVLEYKSTLDLCLRDNKKASYVTESALKTIAAFLNSKGGTLLIGVDDNGEIIGLNEEIYKFHKNNDDKFLLHFKNYIKDRIYPIIFDFIDYRVATVNTKKVLFVKCKPARKPCYFDEEFYVRRNPATDKLKPREAQEYISERFSTSR